MLDVSQALRRRIGATLIAGGLGVGAITLALPCPDCARHRDPAATALVGHVYGAAHHPSGADAGARNAASEAARPSGHAGMPHASKERASVALDADPAPQAPAETTRGARTGTANDDATPAPPAMAWRIGTRARPLGIPITSGRLLRRKTDRSDDSQASTAALAARVLEQTAARAAETAVSGAGPLTTRQATKRLTKSCQRLLKKQTRQRSKADRKRRTKCLAKRRALIKASQAAGPPTAPPPSGPVAPTPPTVGPTPAPLPTNPDGTAVTPPTTTDPVTGDPIEAEIFNTVQVSAEDGHVAFGLTTGWVRPAADGIVYFSLKNNDRQTHNLWIRAHGNTGATPTVIIAKIEMDQAPVQASMVLAPGVYDLICVVPGHGPMTVPFTVYAP